MRYLDGVEFLSESLEGIANDCGLDFSVDFEAKEEGYYAAHVYVTIECEVPDVEWDTKKILVPFEIQITTQLQDVIRNLLHKHYDRRRMISEELGIKWQWDYSSDEFSTNYLGHILHYIEGMIMDIREKQKENG